MANLPDITTADVGMIAFWNAEDHKDAGVVDPTDCTGVFTNYSVYDNGLDGDISLGSGRLFNCRVKNDGWCIAWIDRTNTFGYPTKPAADFGEAGYKGYYDILWSWYADSILSSTLTTLSYIISLFEAALEASGDFTFTSTDVGHYCYEYPDANVITLLDVHRTINGNETGQVQYTNGTSLYYIAVTAMVLQGTVEFDSNILATATATHKYGAADILAENWMPSSLVNYDLKVTQIANYDVEGSILLLWS